jgi:hypothetical protein
VSNTNDYIITTLSSGSKDYTDLSDNQIQAPFSIGAPNARSLRLTGAPYVSTLSNPSNIFTRQIISPGGGGGIPESITARDNLQHWWKMDGPSTSEYSDEGLSGGSTTNLSLTDTTVESGGPSEIGSPSYVEFNGTSAFGQIAVVDTSNVDTNINTIFAAGNFSVSFWMRLESEPSQPNALFNATSRAGGLSSANGVGTWYSSGLMKFLGFVCHAQNGLPGDFSTGTNTVWVSKVESFSNWVNCVMVMDVENDQLRAYVDGTQSGLRTLNGTPDDAQVAGNTGGFGSWLILGAGPSNSANSALTVSNFTNIGMLDFRIYNKVLSTDEINSIASGDWT